MVGKASFIRIALAATAAAAAGFSIHVLYGRGIAATYAATAAQTGRLNQVLKEPYPSWIVVLAATTALIPALGKVVAFLLLRPRLPGTAPWQKGLAFGGLLLLMNDALVRLPLMNVVVGLPADVALVQAVEAWSINLVMGLLISLLASPTDRTWIPRMGTD